MTHLRPGQWLTIALLAVAALAVIAAVVLLFVDFPPGGCRTVTECLRLLETPAP